MKTLLLIDGNAIMHRAFYALPPMNASDGTPTNAVYGFFTMLQKVTSDFQPEYVVVCFDTPVKTFRKTLFADYQAHRPPSKDEFIKQIPIIQNMVDESGITRMEKPGFEADDVIGTLSKRFGSQDVRVLILTGDRDIMQLVDEHIYVITPKVGVSSIVLYNPEAVKAKMLVPPAQIPDLKALAGDPSDNYKGVKGIGPKTAFKLVEQFGTVEHMFEQTDSLKDEKLRNTLIEHKDEILLMKKLATIVIDVDIDLTIEQCAFNGFHKDVEKSIEKYNLYALRSRLLNLPRKKEEPKPVVKAAPPDTDENQPGLF